MSAYQLIHNPRCRKSREALEWLHGAGIDPEVRLYLDDPLSAEELSRLIQFLGIRPLDLVRKEEAVFKESYKGRDLNDQQWIEAMVAHPKLIQRPIFVSGQRAVIGRPPEQVLTLVAGEP